jgi:surface antigen
MLRFRLIAALTILAPAAAAAELDRADEAFRAASYGRAWTGPVGAIQRWSNPASGNGGEIRTVKERRDAASGQPCREIEETVTTEGGTPTTGYAVGCRSSDGGWRIVQASAAETAAPTEPAVVPADVMPYVPPPDIAASGSGGSLDDIPPQVRILVPGRGLPARH